MNSSKNVTTRPYGGSGCETEAACGLQRLSKAHVLGSRKLAACHRAIWGAELLVVGEETDLRMCQVRSLMTLSEQ